ncbi:hypothetical protein [Bacteroides cellulosilyticus]|uniref:Uncharacterized protein n=1 Tax=Bacteroides cellulosilyticus TaxID=246787 RepID=A0A642PTV4_9BACE|nr:hypothetical protein [Bacteroides cellulosilyticus]KAA5415997.1 hypothetical protein F2Y81_16675 [Bacteroides cellulosilyticus]
MRKVAIISSTAPAKPRSEKYPVGASVTRTGGGSTIIQGGGEGVDIVKKDDIKSLTDKNVMSSLRALKEFISKVDDNEVSAIVDFLKGIKIDGNLINRLLLQNTATGEVKDTDVMSALRVLAEIATNNEELKKIFLRKDEIDSTNYLLGLLGGAVVENGLIVRLPKQNAPAALMSCLLEEDIDTLIEEDEDAIVEVAPAEVTDLSFGGLNNVNPSVDNAPIGSLPVKGENEWGYAAPTLFSGSIDEDNMLIPVFDRRIQQMVFIPISVIRGGVTPPATGFPYTFSFALG